MNDFDALGHGSTLTYDRFGDLVDISSSLTERYCLLGKTWRFDLPYSSLSADGIYASISFKTPIVGICFQGLSTVEKTGGELIVSLTEGGTYSGGSILTPVNYNFIINDAHPFQDAYYGVSPTATLSNGTLKASAMLGGSSQGNSKPGGDTQGQGLFVLKPDTVYTLKFTAKGGAVTCAANIGVTYISRYV